MTSTLVLRTIDLTRRARLAQRVELLAPFAALGLVGLGVVGLWAQWRPRDPAGGAAAVDLMASAPAPAPAEAPWRDVALAAPTLKISDSRLAAGAVTFSARLRGDDREDVLTLGVFEGDAPFATVVAAQGAPGESDSGFYVEMARRLAPLGLSIARADLPARRDSRFGAMETTALSLTAGQGMRENCRGFRVGAAAAGLTLSGVVCMPRQDNFRQNFSDRDLVCLLDGLSGADAVLDGFFAAMAGPATCAGPVVAAAAPKPVRVGAAPKSKRVAGKPRQN